MDHHANTTRFCLIAWLAASLLAGCAGANSQPAIGTAPVLPQQTATAGAAQSKGICGNTKLLRGPASAPAGATVVPAGNNTNLSITPNTTYWFAPGVHTFGTSQYGQIIPASGDTFIGAPGAVLDGAHTNLYAFTQHATNVTIEYLTIQNFGPAGSNQNAGVVNHDSGRGWTIQYNTVRDNAGAGVFLGSDNILRDNCLLDNGQYGFSVYAPNGVHDVAIAHNEIAGNDTYHWEQKVSGCGCTGGGKFWDTDRATITGNWVHDNIGPGMWADTDNNDFDFTGNEFDRNDGEGIIIEISYNVSIRQNHFSRNALVYGPHNPGFPTGAIYISESGGDGRVHARYSTIEIADNQFVDNWSGVVLWENADRFCNSPANTSSGYCTLVDPSVANFHTCAAGTIRKQPYYSDCRWKTQNVAVERNTFAFNPATIAHCTVAASCGFQGLFSNWGTYPSWSPYKGDVIERAIAFHQNDRFAANTYTGPWNFMAHDQSVVLDAAQWQGKPYRQDRGSTFE
jgi:hypothetical protein